MSYRNSRSNLGGKVYVGDLPSGASRQELEDSFCKHGQLKNVWVARNPPGFAFVEFEDDRDAKDAVRDLDGTEICGRRVRVELSSGQSRRGGGGRFGRGPPPRRDIRDEKCYECGEKGHFARDCYSKRSSSSRSSYKGRGGRSRSRSRSRSYSPKRRYSRSKSRSRSPSGGGSPERD
ncbi:serine/arginine-rich splicing factor 7-like [Amphiura filiformis]|uniref:serine/arginine-rich splicing factor 7-like n=1 Tax=Amphiura filiformis TaxID=82378 RepID=UPI003B21B735